MELAKFLVQWRAFVQMAVNLRVLLPAEETLLQRCK